jgi:hypothetical protein
MQAALLALMAAGYRPSTSSPGHHQTMIQSLPLTLGISNAAWIKLDAFRKKRNQNDYLGVAVSGGETDEAIAAAAELLATVESHLKSHYPQLLQDFRK